MTVNLQTYENLKTFIVTKHVEGENQLTKTRSDLWCYSVKYKQALESSLN